MIIAAPLVGLVRLVLGPPSPAGCQHVNGVWSYLDQADTQVSSLLPPDVLIIPSILKLSINNN